MPRTAAFKSSGRTALAALAASALVAGPWSPAQASADEQLVLEVSAGACDRQHVAVPFELPEALRDHRHFTMLRLDNGQPVAVQLEDAAAPRLLWMVDELLPSGETRRYQLTAARDAQRPSPQDLPAVAVTCRDDGCRLLVKVGHRTVLAYNHAVVPSPAADQSYYERSGHIHPLFTPAGREVTDDFAPDHMHQHGLMFAWTSSRFEGRAVNFWDQQARQGTVEHARTETLVEGPVFGGFSALLNHVDLTAPDGPKTALVERWHVRVYRRDDAFLFDLTSVQECATDIPLEIGEYHYGGLAIRGHRQWLEPGQGDFLTSQGHSRREGNHSRVRWCDIHGLIAEQPAGVTLMGHPDNFRSPQPVRLHPDKPYFCFAPMVLGDFTIEPGRPYTSRYRFLVHDGQLDAELAEMLWNDFAQPAVVRVVEER